MSEPSPVRGRLEGRAPNERLSEIAARPPGQLRDDGLANAFDRDDRERLRGACQTVVADRLEVIEEAVLRTPDGDDPRVEVRLTPLIAADGVAYGVVGVVQESPAPAADPKPSLTPTVGYVAYLE